MTICFFGNYIKDYPRVQVLRKGLRQNGAKVLECHTRNSGIRKYLDLYRQHKKVKNQYDILLVCMGGYMLTWFAKLLTKKPVIFDFFVSLYLTNVEDRKIFSRGSLKAKYYAFLDKFSCRFADKVLLDTQAQIDYVVGRYNLDPKKFIRVFVGSDDEVFFPAKIVGKDLGKFIVHWHGHIVPFHGLETVIKAAQKLKDNEAVEFQVVTRFNGKFQKIKNLTEHLGLTNIKFYPEVDYQSLAKMINQADICLGIFGDNEKARVVIPNKIYEAIACGKPVITARHAVLQELFVDGENIIMAKPADPDDLAKKILELKDNPALRNKLAENTRALFEDKLTPKIIGRQLLGQALELSTANHIDTF
ncbi:MAG: hypothetical protein A2102_02890 [Tenericutes bacterium GWF2_38_8]|nr:MAG: hypothetical protein A2102_02890 [Tenericutes bacterium GWF2_38_8]